MDVKSISQDIRDFSGELKAKRKASGKTQTEMATALDISSRTYNRWESDGTLAENIIKDLKRLQAVGSELDK